VNFLKSFLSWMIIAAGTSVVKIRSTKTTEMKAKESSDY
jgi:hypothetical protein